MTKPGFVEKRIELALNEESSSKYNSDLERDAFMKGARFMIDNLDVLIEKPFYAYVVMRRDSKHPIISTHTKEDLETLLDDYCGVGEKYNNSGKRLSYMAHNVKYPSDYEGYYMYEIKDGENLRIEHYDVYCVEYKPKSTK